MGFIELGLSLSTSYKSDNVFDNVWDFGRFLISVTYYMGGSYKEKMGWMMGLEPTTTGTTIRCSAIELHPPQKTGRGAEIRTRDLLNPIQARYPGCATPR